MNLKNAMRAIAIAAVALMATSASALDFHGYFREGVGFNSKGGNQACFSVGLYKARLGNECDLYGEWEFSQTIYKDDNGVEVKYVFMPAYGVPVTVPSEGGGELAPGYGYGTGNLYVQQNWAGIKLPQLNGATIWAGDRYYKREDVHSYDFFYYNPQQGHPTVGIEDVSLGFAKMALAISSVGTGAVTGAWMMPALHIYDIPLLENGTLQLIATMAVPMKQDADPTLGAGTDPKTSPWFTVDYLQDKFLGGSNKLTFQYAMGSLAGMGGPSATATSDDKRIRVIDQLYFQPTPQFSGAFVFIWEGVSTPVVAGGSGENDFSFELRPAYHVSDYFKLAVDASYQIRSPKDAPAGVDSTKLLKITVAPTLVTGRGFFARPEFRLFATYGKWSNVAAQQAFSGAFADKDNGLSFGAQVEAWW